MWERARIGRPEASPNGLISLAPEDYHSGNHPRGGRGERLVAANGRRWSANGRRWSANGRRWSANGRRWSAEGLL